MTSMNERFARGRSGHREIKTNIRNDDISAIDTPPGCSWGSTDPEENYQQIQQQQSRIKNEL